MTNRYIEFKTFHHFPEYVAARNALIPEAERIANETVGPKPKNADPYEMQPYDHKKTTVQWVSDWNIIFFREMDRLARETGLTK